jgi:hypothetical protein
MHRETMFFMFSLFFPVLRHSLSLCVVVVVDDDENTRDCQRHTHTCGERNGNIVDHGGRTTNFQDLSRISGFVFFYVKIMFNAFVMK